MSAVPLAAAACCESVSLLRLDALMLLALVCTRSRLLLVLLRRLVNSVKLSRLTLDADCRFSVALRCSDVAVAVTVVVAAAWLLLLLLLPAPSSEVFFPEGRGDMPETLGDVGMIPTRCG